MRGEATDSGKVHNGDTNIGETWGKTSARARCKTKGAARQRRWAAGTKQGKARGAKVKRPRAIPARDCPRPPSHGLEELLSLRGSRWQNKGTDTALRCSPRPLIPPKLTDTSHTVNKGAPSYVLNYIYSCRRLRLQNSLRGALVKATHTHNSWNKNPRCVTI